MLRPNMLRAPHCARRLQQNAGHANVAVAPVIRLHLPRKQRTKPPVLSLSSLIDWSIRHGGNVVARLEGRTRARWALPQQTQAQRQA